MEALTSRRAVVAPTRRPYWLAVLSTTNRSQSGLAVKVGTFGSAASAPQRDLWRVPETHEHLCVTRYNTNRLLFWKADTDLLFRLNRRKRGYGRQFVVGTTRVELRFCCRFFDFARFRVAQVELFWLRKPTLSKQNYLKSSQHVTIFFLSFLYG